jgi:hypothetical protein
LLIEPFRGDGAHPLPFFVECLGLEVFEVEHAGSRLIHLAFAVELSGGQVASDRRVSGPDANQLADDGHGSTEDGDGENHLEERQAAALEERRMTNVLGHLASRSA